MNILTIDPGTNGGWACRRNGKFHSGIFKLSVNRGDSPGLRYIQFNDWLTMVFEFVDPDLVVYELPFMRGGHATMFLHGLITRIHEKCTKENVEYESVNPMTLKKEITGSGAANKEMMVKTINKLWKHTVLHEAYNDNEADALGMLTLAIRRHV